MSVESERLRLRTKQFAVRVLKMCEAVPKTDAARVLTRQLMRSATSVAANYRATCRARSRKEFVAKVGLVVEEADESVCWIELMIESGVVAEQKVALLLKEANELLAIFAASQRTARRKSSMTRSSMNQ